MSFWDNVKKFTQPYADDDYDDDDYDDYPDDEPEEPAPRASRRASGGTGAASSASTYTNPAPASDLSMDFGTPSVSGSNAGSFSGQVLNMNASKQEVVLFHAKSFDSAAKAADELRAKKAVILNMENVDKALTRRVVDFLSGCVYALDGKVKKIAQSSYLFCPHNMDIVGDLENFQQTEVESYI